jgi:hypothetical protein
MANESMIIRNQGSDLSSRDPDPQKARTTTDEILIRTAQTITVVITTAQTPEVVCVGLVLLFGLAALTVIRELLLRRL